MPFAKSASDEGKYESKIKHLRAMCTKSLLIYFCFLTREEATTKLPFRFIYYFLRSITFMCTDMLLSKCYSWRKNVRCCGLNFSRSLKERFDISCNCKEYRDKVYHANLCTVGVFVYLMQTIS